MTDAIYTAFIGEDLVARGSLAELIQRLHAKAPALQGELRIFDESSGRALDFDWRGDAVEVENRARAQIAAETGATVRTRGRPKLGVESREVTLLPRQWAWLEAQGGGASAALRRLIDRHIKATASDTPDIDPVYRLASALGGDHPRFEEAARLLYRGQWREAEDIFLMWPGDIGPYLAKRLRAAVGGASCAADAPLSRHNP